MIPRICNSACATLWPCPSSYEKLRLYNTMSTSLNKKDTTTLLIITLLTITLLTMTLLTMALLTITLLITDITYK